MGNWSSSIHCGCNDLRLMVVFRSMPSTSMSTKGSADGPSTWPMPSTADVNADAVAIAPCTGSVSFWRSFICAKGSVGGKFLALTTTTRNSFQGRSGAPGVSRLNSLGILRTLSGSWTNLKASSTRITGLVGSRLERSFAAFARASFALCAAIFFLMAAALALRTFAFDIFVPPGVSSATDASSSTSSGIWGSSVYHCRLLFLSCKGSSSTRIEPTNLLTGPLS